MPRRTLPDPRSRPVVRSSWAWSLSLPFRLLHLSAGARITRTIMHDLGRFVLAGRPPRPDVREGGLPVNANKILWRCAMRLVTVSARGVTRVGAEVGAWIIDLNHAGRPAGTPARMRALLPPSMNEFLAGGEDAMAAAREVAGKFREPLGDPREAARQQRARM